jgi:hypothetical protein
MRYCLNYKQRVAIIEHLEKLNMSAPTCSACESKVDISWLRKLDDQPLHHAMCVPCFLHNHTDTDQDMIDKMVQVGEKAGFYKDEPVAQPNWDAIMKFK